MSWNASTDSDGSIDSYEVTYKLSSVSSYGNPLVISNGTEKSITNLQPDTSYDIRVRAKDNEGAYSDYATITVKTKAIPKSNAIDTSKFTWQQIKPNDGNGWSGGSLHTSVVFKNKMWVIGGGGNNRYLSDDVHSSTDGVNWTLVKNSNNQAWTERNNHQSVVFKDQIWLLGGYDFSYTNDVWRSSNGKDWTEVKNIPWQGRAHHRSIVFKDKIWVIGGNDNPADSSAYFYDIWNSSDGTNWQKVSNPTWSKRGDFTSVVFDNKIWIMGGYNDGIYLNDVWSSPDGKNWTQVTANAPWSARSVHTSIVFNNKIWILGGFGQSDINNDIWSSVDGKNWTQEKSGNWSDRGFHTSIVFDNKIWVMGGNDGSNSLNDVWAFGDFSQ